MYEDSYGQKKLTFIDNFGVALSQRPILAVFDDPRYRGGSAEVLEVGCGFHAPLLVSLLPRVRRAVGIDAHISEDLKREPKLQFHEGTLDEALPHMAGQTFDVILMISVLEHLEEPRKALETLYAMLKPGGTLVVNVPTWNGKVALELSAFRFKLSTPESIDDHKTYYDKRDLWPLLVAAGFKPSQISMRYHKFSLNLFAVCKKPG
jgi:SAM-dependent methyltransferase